LAEDADRLYRKVGEWFERTQETGQREFYQVLFLTWSLISSDLRVNRREVMLQSLFASMLRHTHSRNVVIKKKHVITVRLRPDFVSTLIQHIPGYGWLDDVKHAPRRIAFRDLYAGLSRECDGEIGLITWFSAGKNMPSVPLIEEVGCTEEIRQLLAERFDADAVPKRRGKKS
jgi:hypothetical protein